MDTIRPVNRSAWLLHAAGLAAAAALAAVVLWTFHARLLWPPDDGAYAHVAQRMLDGEVLHRDVQDVHTGYINFTNALALAVFGDDLVSLRYPLVAVGVVSAALAYLLLLPRGFSLALAGSACVSTLTIVQFVNPTAHWYCLLLLLCMVGSLTWLPRGSRYRLELAGFFAVVMFLFRQLSGVLAGIGLVAYLLAEAPRDGKGGETIVARGLSLIMTVGLAAYLASKTGPTAFILYGVWPLAILIWLVVNAAVVNRAALTILARLSIGGIAAALPLLAYHLYMGSTGAWLEDTIFRAESLTQLDFFRSASYGVMLAASILQMLSGNGAVGLLNAAYWTAALLAGTMLGWLVVRLIGRFANSSALAPLPFVAVFYSVVSLHFQIAIYLHYTLAISMLGLLWIAGSTPLAHRKWAVAAACAMACVGLYFHAGQPLTRGTSGMLAGRRVAVASCARIERCSLWMDPADVRTYEKLIKLVKTHSRPDESILAIPVNPELYFLTGRRNPCRFFNSALGVSSSADLQSVIDGISARPPRLVVYRPADKYNTAHSAALMNYVRRRYQRLDSIGEFEVYLSPRVGAAPKAAARGAAAGEAL